MDSKQSRVVKKNHFQTIERPGDSVEIWVTPVGLFANVNVGLIDRKSQTVALIDPIDGAGWIKKLRKEDLVATHIILTHTHRDHTWGIGKIRKAFPEVEIHAHKEALHPRDDIRSKMLFGEVSPTHYWTMPAHKESTLSIGGMEWTVTHTPGHAPGHVTLHGHGVFLSGDLLFSLLSGRCDLPGSDPIAQLHSLRRVRETLRELPPDQPLIPGHNYSWIDGTKPTWVSIEEVLEHNRTLQKLDRHDV